MALNDGHSRVMLRTDDRNGSASLPSLLKAEGVDQGSGVLVLNVRKEILIAAPKFHT